MRHAVVLSLALLCATETVTCAQPPAGFDEDAALGRSVASTGGFERIARAFDRARRGQSVTIGAIGGSVTQGAWASSARGRYLDLVADWWRQQFPGAAVRVVNAGIGGTESNYGALRVGRDLLAAAPDVVIVEFSVNDAWTDASVESYEGLVRQILRAPRSPAVLLLALADATGNSAQPLHVRVARYYNLPMVSLGDALRPLYDTAPARARTYYQDAIHPNDQGHALIARLVTHWLELALQSADGQGGRPLTGDVFERTHLLAAAALSPASANGWSYSPPLQAWQADTPGATLVCDVSGTALFLSYFIERGPRGQLAVGIDGRPPVIVDTWNESAGDGRLQVGELARGLPPGSHRVVLRVLDSSNSESQGHAVRVFGIAAAVP